MVNPYTEQVTGNTRLREFAADTDEMDLVWHRDANNRKVTPIVCDGWKFQYDEQPPQEMKEGETFEIEARTYHRILKGKGKLVLRIEEE